MAIVLFRSTAEFSNKPFGVATLPGAYGSAACWGEQRMPCREERRMLCAGMHGAGVAAPAQHGMHPTRPPFACNPSRAAAILLRFCILAVGSMVIGVGVALACAAVLKRFNQMEPSGGRAAVERDDTIGWAAQAGCLGMPCSMWASAPGMEGTGWV